MSLIVRDRETGKPVAVPISSIPEEIRPDNWYENPQWQYSRALLSEEVAEFFKDSKAEIHEQSARRLAQYIYDYAANIAVAGWLFGDNKQEYLEFMRPCLQQLRTLKEKAQTKRDILDMIHISMDYAVDPF